MVQVQQRHDVGWLTSSRRWWAYPLTLAQAFSGGVIECGDCKLLLQAKQSRLCCTCPKLVELL